MHTTVLDCLQLEPVSGIYLLHLVEQSQEIHDELGYSITLYYHNLSPTPKEIK
jgi:hypothetical protein